MDKKGSFTALNCEIAVFPVGLKPAAVWSQQESTQP
jgi:hypothetical protein